MRAKCRNRSLTCAVVFSAATGVFSCGSGDASSAGAPGIETARAADSEAALSADAGLFPRDRLRIDGDLYLYTFVLAPPAGDGALPLTVHRVVRECAPWQPRKTERAALLLHGDFATFLSNFLPQSPATPPRKGLAAYLAEQDIDVWGLDRRWAAVDADHLSELAAMSVQQEMRDVREALAFARKVREASGSGDQRLSLVGFSHGAELAYVYAGDESQRPPDDRHVKGLVALDYFVRFAPADDAARLAACASRDDERSWIAQGYVEFDNTQISQEGKLARSAPGDASPYGQNGQTNRQALLAFVAQTYQLFAPTPSYHLAAGVFDGDTATAFRFAPELRIADWLSAAPIYMPIVEGADFDALNCADGNVPFDDHLADIRVPAFYLGAAGGIGDHGLYTTQLLGSRDVTSTVVRKLDISREREDVGHADLLYADDAGSFAWRPIARWIATH
jgi:hypothetical protein